MTVGLSALELFSQREHYARGAATALRAAKPVVTARAHHARLCDCVAEIPGDAELRIAAIGVVIARAAGAIMAGDEESDVGG